MKTVCFALLLCAVSGVRDPNASMSRRYAMDQRPRRLRYAQRSGTGDSGSICVEPGSATPISAASISIPALTSLDLSLTHITDRGMQEIKNLRGITDLNLYFAEYVTDEGVAAIKDWKQLKRLNLHGTKAGDTALEHIAGITRLSRWMSGPL